MLSPEHPHNGQPKASVHIKHYHDLQEDYDSVCRQLMRSDREKKKLQETLESLSEDRHSIFGVYLPEKDLKALEANLARLEEEKKNLVGCLVALSIAWFFAALFAMGEQAYWSAALFGVLGVVGMGFAVWGEK